MIISIRGTSGSGKSTIVRRIMDCYHERIPVYLPGRKQPLLYNLYEEDGNVGPVVIGHYESPCGGCDTIESFDKVFELVRNYSDLGYDVLFEGVLLYSEIPRTVLAAQAYGLLVIALNTSLDECLNGVIQRRLERDDWEPLDPSNTAGKHRGTISSMKKLQEQGVEVVWEDRQSAYELIIDKLNLNPAFKLL